MKRRAFALMLGGAALTGTIAAAQVMPRVPRVAVLDWTSASAERMAPFRRALRELGYVEGETILVSYHFAEGRAERAAVLAAEIAVSGVDVIVALATPAALAVQRATSTIPIVSSTADPIGSGLVGNLARPGGNLTGISNMMPDIESKRMELLRELLPDARRFAFLGSARDPATRNFVRAAQVAAAAIGATVEPVLIDNADGIDAALADLARARIDAVIVQPLFTLDPGTSRVVAELAARHRVAAITNYAWFPRAGGLVSYGVNPDTALPGVAQYVDRILKGAKPGDLPIQQPTAFELVLNLKTAKMLGITIPPMTLLRADEVID